MRTMALLILLLVTNGLFANPLGTALFEKTISGGFVPPEMTGWSTKVSISSDGSVYISKKRNENSPWEHNLVALLSFETMLKLHAIADNVVAGQLIFDDAPACTDTPVTTYTATNSSQEPIVFAQIVACNTGYLDSFYGGYQLQNLLDGFAGVDHLQLK